MSIYTDLKQLKKKSDYNSQRLFAELNFAWQFDKTYNCGAEADIEKLARKAALAEVTTKQDVENAEKALSELGKSIKKLDVLAVAHAHIDMNWMWRFDETVNITLSTFRTILNFMKEYEGFTFAQSQASVYKIVEQYDHEMLQEIKRYIKQGRWEPTVAAWVEPDKNMPSGETLSRHLLYSKQYVSKLLDYPIEKLNLDFEPDTFGHNANVPQILAQGGVKYYYHCRGYEGEHIYRWRKGENEVLVYREPVWYNAEITYDDFSYIPQFAKKYNITTLLKVYGVGDHGGGPTRRDIERLIDMMSWPLMPNIKFGTYAQYFGYLDGIRNQFAIVEGELNNFSAGCYTTQTRIKRMNKTCENQLYEAEYFNAMSDRLGGYKYDGAKFAEAWEKLLFNNFHDILPGSGTADTREHAMGTYQECLATAASRKSLALSSIAKKIDTSKYIVDVDANSVSEGAGGGYNHLLNDFGCADRGCGKQRIFHLFNSAETATATPHTVTVWDYPDDLNDAEFVHNGKVIPAQLLDAEPVFYWGHLYQRFAIDVPIQPFGYATVVLRPKENGDFAYPFPTFPRLDARDSFVLENQYLRAEFDTQSCALRKLIDKRNGKTVIDKQSAYFRLITEDATKEMTAWMIGRYNDVEDLTRKSIVRPRDYVTGKLIQSLTCEIPFGNASKLFVTVKLENNSTALKYECKCDFREVGAPHVSVPNLSLYIPCKPIDNKYLSGIAFGNVERSVGDYDMPSINGVFVKTASGNFGVISNSKYGFRVTEDYLQMTVARNSYEPDPLPDFGLLEFDFALAVVDDFEQLSVIAKRYAHPCSSVTLPAAKSELPENGSLIEINGASVSSIKISEKGDGIIARLYQSTKEIRIKTKFDISDAYLCDLQENETKQLKAKNNTVTLPQSDGIVTIKIK